MNFNPALPDIPDNDYLMHYGVGKLDGAPGPGSGRYPLGSGEHGNQRMDNFRNVYTELKKQHLTEKEIADAIAEDDEKEQDPEAPDNSNEDKKEIPLLSVDDSALPSDNEMDISDQKPSEMASEVGLNTVQTNIEINNTTEDIPTSHDAGE